MPRYSKQPGNLDSHDTERLYRSLIFSIINGLQEAEIVKATEKIDTFISNEGRRVYKTQRLSTFPGLPKEEQDMGFGMHKEPGQVPIKRVKGKNGGKSFKYNRAEKDYLTQNASQELQLVDLTKEQFYSFCKAEKWYTTKSENYDQILKNHKIDLYWDLYQSHMDTSLFLSRRSDARTRMMYNFTNTVFGVHTKGGKYLWQARTPILVHAKGQELQIKCAVTIAKGKRHNTTESMDIWNHERDAILTKLSTWDDKVYFGENIYNQRLAQAIIDTEEGVATKFLPLVDFTNMGLISNACEFRDNKTMIAANISALSEPQDSHMILAHACNVNRQNSKDIGQGLYHGQSLQAVCNNIENIANVKFTVSALSSHLVEELGEGILNISKIAAYTRDMHDNFNTVLYFNTLDGWKAQSIAYVESVDYKIFGLSNKAEKGYITMQVTSDLPLKLSNSKKNNAVYNTRKKTKVKGERKGSLTKNNGGFANIAHSIDAWIERRCNKAAIDAGYVGINIYDNYGYNANAIVDVIIPTAIDCFMQIRRDKPYARAVAQMRDMKKGNKPPMLSGLHYGEDELVISKENNFFSA